MKSWLARKFRGRRLDHNPLRRRIDRAETVVTLLLMMALASAAPFILPAAAGEAYSLGQHARVTAIATRQEVTAVTLQPAPIGTYAQGWVIASWTAPDGRQRTGQVQVGEGVPKGTPARIWVTRSGDIAPPPLPVSELSQLATIATVGAGLGLALFFLVMSMAIRHAFNRRRLATWDAEWAAVEPRWNRQRW